MYNLLEVKNLEKSYDGKKIINKYVSHYMEEVEAICNRILLLDQGNVIENCAKEELKQKYKTKGFNSLEEIFLSITGTQLRDTQERKC